MLSFRSHKVLSTILCDLSVCKLYGNHALLLLAFRNSTFPFGPCCSQPLIIASKEENSLPDKPTDVNWDQDDLHMPSLPSLQFSHIYIICQDIPVKQLRVLKQLQQRTCLPSFCILCRFNVILQEAIWAHVANECVGASASSPGSNVLKEAHFELRGVSVLCLQVSPLYAAL